MDSIPSGMVLNDTFLYSCYYFCVFVVSESIDGEANFKDLCTEIWVVHCTKDQQLKRLMERDSLSQDEAIKRIQIQWPLDKKIKFADFVIDNSSEPEIWKKQIEMLI